MINITNYTDPVCSWCWGSEPMLRGLETRYPGLVNVRYVMVGLVDNIDNFTDPSNGIDAGSDGANAQIIGHWFEGEARHHMPIEDRGFKLFSKEFPSTFPQNIAYKAAQLVNQELADKYLRRLREATMVESLVTSDPNVQIELASEVGLDVGEFITALNSDEAKELFQQDRIETYQVGAQGFPSWVIEVNGKRLMLRGFNSLDSFIKVIEMLSNKTIQPQDVHPNVELLENLLSKHGHLAAEEVYLALNFNDRDEVESWVKEHGYVTEKAGNSFFVSQMKMGMACDPVTGVCL